MFTFKVVGTKGQYAELPELEGPKYLQPGEFYFCKLQKRDLNGDDVLDVDFAHCELIDQKIGREIIRNVKVVRFLKGRSFVGVEGAEMRLCRLDQLPTCTFYGPMKIEVAAVEVGDVIEEIAE